LIKQNTTVKKGGGVKVSKKNNGTRFPVSIHKFSQNWSRQQQIHPTQKPIPLMEYLIKTYTNENETVLDFTMGSGTTMVACKNLNRNGIGIEQDPEYYDIAVNRLNE
jgi:site-specific DNA-methyltransferase (adenine-specific)